MKVDTIHTIEVRLTLSAAQALWLKSLVQNPHCPPSEEPAESAQLRQELFDALPSFQTLRSETLGDRDENYRGGHPWQGS